MITANFDIEKSQHIRQTNERLAIIRQQLCNAQSFVAACSELLQWCSDPRAFQTCYEDRLIDCLNVVYEVRQQSEFHHYNNLTQQLLAICEQYATTRDGKPPSSDFSDKLISWFRKSGGHSTAVSSSSLPSSNGLNQQSNTSLNYYSTDNYISSGVSDAAPVPTSNTMMHHHGLVPQQPAQAQKQSQAQFMPGNAIDQHQFNWQAQQQSQMGGMIHNRMQPGQGGMYQSQLRGQAQSTQPPPPQHQMFASPGFPQAQAGQASQKMGYPPQTVSPALTPQQQQQQQAQLGNASYYAPSMRSSAAPISLHQQQPSFHPQQHLQPAPSPENLQQMRLQYAQQQQQQQHQQMVMMSQGGPATSSSSTSSSRAAPYPNPQELAIRRRMQQQQQQQQQQQTQQQHPPQVMSPLSPMNTTSNITPYKVQAPVVQLGGSRLDPAAASSVQPPPPSNNPSQMASLQAHHQQQYQQRLMAAQQRQNQMQQRPLPSPSYAQQISSPPLMPPGHQQQPYKIAAASPAQLVMSPPPPQAQVVKLENSPSVLQPVPPVVDTEPRMTLLLRDGVLLPPFRLEHSRSTSTMQFFISDQIFEMLSQKQGNFELQLKCFHHDDQLMQTSWPASVSVLVNRRPMIIDRSREAVVMTERPGSPRVGSSTRPLFIKSVCQPGENELTISVTACCCSHLFVLELVQRPSVISMQNTIVRERLVRKDVCIAKIKKMFFVSNNSAPDRPLDGVIDVQSTGEVVPLRCPMTSQAIQIPARGAQCRHLRCFDLPTFLAVHSNRIVWACPICSNRIGVENLEVDELMFEMLQYGQQKNLPVHQLDAMIDVDGNWKLVKHDPQSIQQRLQRQQRQQQLLLQQQQQQQQQLKQQQQQQQQQQQIPASVANWNYSPGLMPNGVQQSQPSDGVANFPLQTDQPQNPNHHQQQQQQPPPPQQQQHPQPQSLQQSQQLPQQVVQNQNPTSLSNQQNYLPPTPTSTIPCQGSGGSSASNTPYAADSVSSVGSSSSATGHNTVSQGQLAPTSSSSVTAGHGSAVKPATPAVGPLPHSIAMTPQSPMSVGANGGPPSNSSHGQHLQNGESSYHRNNTSNSSGAGVLDVLVEDLVVESTVRPESEPSQPQPSQQQSQIQAPAQLAQQQLPPPQQQQQQPLQAPQTGSDFDFEVNFFEDFLVKAAANDEAASAGTVNPGGQTVNSQVTFPANGAIGDLAAGSDDPFEGIFDS